MSDLFNTVLSRKMLRGGRIAKTSCGIVSFAPVIAFGSIVLASGNAKAADECGAPIGGVVNCASYNGPGPISYINVEGLDLILGNSDLTSENTTNSVTGAVFVTGAVGSSGDIVINADLFDDISNTAPSYGGAVLGGAILAIQNGEGNARIVMGENSGLVRTTGTNSHGVYAVQTATGLGDATVVLNGGEITTAGRARALFSRIQNLESEATSTAIMTGGKIVTSTAISD